MPAEIPYKWQQIAVLLRYWSDPVRGLGVCVCPSVFGAADATGMDYARNAFVMTLESSKMAPWIAGSELH
jgi:hypothetical protein